MDGDLVVGECEQLFAQLVVVLLLPLPSQELGDFCRSIEEPAAIAPDRVGGIGFGNGLRIATRISVSGLISLCYELPGVPEILSFLDLCTSGLFVEGRRERHLELRCYFELGLHFAGRELAVIYSPFLCRAQKRQLVSRPRPTMHCHQFV